MKKRKLHLGKKLISNIVYLFFDWLVLSLFSFVFWMIIGKTLNPSDVGIVAVSISLIIFIGRFSNLGINNAIQKLIPEIKEKKGLKGVYPFVKLSIKPVLISLLIIFLILLFFSNQLSSFIKIPYYAFLICIFSIAIFSVYQFLGSALYGIQNMKKYFLTDFIQMILRVVITGLLVFLALNYFIQYKNYLYIPPLIAFLFGYFFVIFLRFNRNYLKKGQPISYRKLFFYATPALISTLAAALINRGQYIILTILTETEITGVFAIAFTITSTIGSLTHIPNYALFPIISVLSIDKKTKKKQGYLIGLVLRYSMFLIIPLALLLITFSKYAVLLFSTEKFLDSTQLFPILTLGAIFFGVGEIFISNLYAIGKPKLHRNIYVSSSLLFLILSLILTNYFSAIGYFPAIGLSISYLVAMLLFFSLSFGYMKKYVKPNLFIKDILKVLISSLVIILILFILKPFIHNVFVLGIILFPISLFYLVLLLFVKFYRIEDVKILRYFGEKVPTVGKYILTVANFIESRL